MQHNTQVPVGKHNNRQHASPHHEVATDVKQMPIRPIIVIKQLSSFLCVIYIRPQQNIVNGVVTCFGGFPVIMGDILMTLCSSVLSLKHCLYHNLAKSHRYMCAILISAESMWLAKTIAKVVLCSLKQFALPHKVITSCFECIQCS